MQEEPPHMKVGSLDGIAVLQFSGDMDAMLVRKLRPLLDLQLQKAEGPNYIADISRVRFLDSNGVGLFVSLLKRAHAKKGRLSLVGAQGQPLSVLNMVGFNETLVKFHRTLEEACEDMTQAEA